MKTYNEKRNAVIRFLNENEYEVDAYELARISKSLCSCSTCKYFAQHYLKDGTAVEFGHCFESNTLRPRRPYQVNCGKWDIDTEAKDTMLKEVKANG